MKQLFYIQDNKQGNPQRVLTFRIGEKHAGFALTDQQGTALYQLAYCTANEWDEKELASFLAAYPVLNENYYEIQVAYDYSPSVLIPLNDFKPGEANRVWSSLYGISAATVLETEPLPEWQLCNLYLLPGKVKEWIKQLFPSAKYRHQFSLGIKNMNSAGDEGKLSVDFREDVFTLLAGQKSRLLLAQTFEYTSPEDVIYYLLKTCRQFSLLQTEVRLELSGLITRQSVLFNELYHYFIQIGFREPQWTRHDCEYPSHFFTSFNDLSACVS